MFAVCFRDRYVVKTSSVTGSTAPRAPRCPRQVCNLCKALSKEASDDNLWKLTPKMHMVHQMREVKSELLGNPRQFWTCRD